MRRARREADRQARQQQILDAASALLSSRTLPAITMVALAAEAGLAKGTLYLYFRTREEVFVALAHAELSAWLGDLRALLPGSVASVSVQLADTAMARPRLLMLLQVLHGTLASNLSAAAAARAASMHRTLLAQGGAQLERLLPALSVGHGQAAFVELYAMLVGLSQVGPDRLSPPSVQPPTRRLHAAMCEAAQALLSRRAQRR